MRVLGLKSFRARARHKFPDKLQKVACATLDRQHHEEESACGARGGGVLGKGFKLSCIIEDSPKGCIRV